MSKKREIKKKIKDAQIEQFLKIVEDFKHESDRALVVLGAARIDLCLFHILSKALLPISGNNDDLLDTDKPLGTFSAKINMCYRLGIIDSEFSKILHLIRKIRNSFAHEISGTTLDSGPHQDRIREILSLLRIYPSYTKAKHTFFGDENKTSNDFRMILILAIVRLEAALDLSFHDIKIVNVPVCIKPDKWLSEAKRKSVAKSSQNSKAKAPRNVRKPAIAPSNTSQKKS